MPPPFRAIGVAALWMLAFGAVVCADARAAAPTPTSRPEFDPPEIRTSWDDLTAGVQTQEDWARRRAEIRLQLLQLIRDEHKPAKPPLDLQVHETVDVEGIYTRKLVSYNVEEDERAHAYLAIPKQLEQPAPAVVHMHGTYAQGKRQSAGLEDNPDKAFLDHFARRGYVVIAPDHFVAGHRTPPEGPYYTTRFYQKHPEWTAVGKFTYENTIAIDVLQSLPEVDSARIGAVGHSLGGQSTYYLAAYDERVKAAACNCAAPTFRNNARVLDWSRDRWYVYLKHLRPDLLEGRLPAIDTHHVIALIAPRPFLDLAALNDGNWRTQQHRVLMNMKIIDVYALLGVPQNYAFYVHGRGHSVAHESRQLIFAWLDTHLKTPAATATRLVEEGR